MKNNFNPRPWLLTLDIRSFIAELPIFDPEDIVWITELTGLYDQIL